MTYNPHVVSLLYDSIVNTAEEDFHGDGRRLCPSDKHTLSLTIQYNSSVIGGDACIKTAVVVFRYINYTT